MNVYEPNPEKHACAVEAIRMNGIGNAVLIHVALSAHEGEVSLQVTAEGMASGGTSRIVGRAAARDRVPVVRIDDIVSESADIRVIPSGRRGA